MRLDLEPAERDLLVDLLETALGEMRVEVRHTQRAAYRDGLQGQEERLKALLERLRGTEGS